MPKTFPVSFNFRAFESISKTIDKINGKFSTLKTRVQAVNNQFIVANKKTEDFRKSLNKVGSRIKGVGQTLSLFVTAPLVALGAKFVQVASDADETANKFNEVFKEVDAGAREGSVQKLAKEFKLSERNAQDFLSTTGLIAKGLDLSSSQALSMASTLSALSQDVASFRNVQGGARQVMEAFNGALTGERERLKSLGIVITETDVKNKALEMAQKGARFETVKQAKALATLAIIQDRTKDDLGDFNRTLSSFSNQMRVTAERFDSVAKVAGNILKPIAAALLGVINRLMEAFLNLSPTMQKVVVIGAMIAAVIGPLLVLFGGFLTLLPSMITGFTLFSTVIIPLLKGLPLLSTFLGILKVAIFGVGKALLFLLANPVGLVITGIALLVAGVIRAVSIWDELVASFKAGKGILESISNVFKTFFGIGSDEKTLTVRKEDIKRTEGGESVGGRADGANNKAQAIGREFAKELRTVNDARVQVDFANAPRGTRVSSRATGVPPDLNLGFAGAPL